MVHVSLDKLEINMENVVADEVASILGAVLKKIGGGISLVEDDFAFNDEESDIILAPQDDGSLLVALGKEVVDE